MKAKHFSKNVMSHKLVFLAVGIALAIIAAFSICATSQAKAETNESNEKGVWQLIVSENYTVSHQLDVYGWHPGPNDDFVDNWESGEYVKDYINEYYNDVWGLATKVEISQAFNGQYHELYFKFYENSDLLYILEFDVTDTLKEIIKPNVEFAWYLDKYGQVPDIDDLESKPIIIEASEFDTRLVAGFSDGPISDGINIAGQIIDEQAGMPVPFANVVYCQYNPWWDMYLPVEGVEPVKTDMWGWYTIEGITEEMLPGKVFVYDGIKKIGESEPIWFFPEDMETLYMWPIVVNQEQPDPPVPPTPPDPPVPPGPVPPEPVPPVPPVPPTPVPTPDNPGGGIAQTSDNTGNALVIFAIVALLGAGVLTGRKLYSR